MKFLQKMIGYTIVGITVMAVWGEFGKFGIFGGFLAAPIIIGPMWFMNHYINLTGNADDAAFVDMGLAIGVCGIFRDTFLKGSAELTNGLPTIALVIIGAIIGGLLAAMVEKNMEKESLEK